MASQALADVLFGVFNPTGKLSATMYPPSFVDELPLTEMSLTAGPGRTHLYYTGTPEFVFGHGLSYSSWDLAWENDDVAVHELEVPLVLTRDQNIVRVGVKVTNRGPREGSETILFFWRPTRAQHKIREKLAGFNGTGLLDANQTEIVEFEVSLPMFEVWHEAQGVLQAESGTYYLDVRGSNGVAITQLIRIHLGNEALSLYS